MTKVAFVSIAFPPKRDPEAIQVAKYFKYLNAQNDLELSVVTSANPTLYMDVDPDLAKYAEGNFQLVERKLFENRYLNALLHRTFPFLLQYPDNKYSFWKGARKVAKRLTTKPDVVYSRSYPLSSSIMGYKLSQLFDVPWIIHLSDPWALSSRESKSPATYFHPIARKWNKKWERKSFERASWISLTSSKTIDLYKQHYPEYAHKMVLFPNVFDEAQVEANPISFEGKFRIVYTGGFGEKRDPDHLLQPITELYDESPELFENIELKFTGDATRINLKKLESYKRLPFFDYLGLLPYDELRLLQRSAHLFLNVDSPITNPSEAVFFPSKLLDYIMAQRKTLAISSQGSMTFDILEPNLGYCFLFEEKERVKEFIRTIIGKYEAHDATYFELERIPQELGASYQAEKLAALFRETAHGVNHKD